MQSRAFRIPSFDLAVVCLLSLTLAAGTAAAQPYQCGDIEAYVVQQADATFYEVDQNLHCTPICEQMGMEINNLGFRSADGLIYGVQLTRNGNQAVLRINPRNRCEHEVLDVRGLPQTERFDSGDITPDGRWLFISRAGFSPIYVVDLADLHLPFLTAVPMSFVGDDGAVNDWAYNPRDGRLYGGDKRDGQLAVVDFGWGTNVTADANVVGLRTDYDILGLPAGVHFGGAWFQEEHLVLYQNHKETSEGIGVLFVIDITDPAHPVIDTAFEDIGSKHNDGARCEDCGAYVFQDRGTGLFRCDPSPSADGGCTRVCGDLGMEINNMGFWNGQIWGVELTRHGNGGLVVMDPASGCAEPVSLGTPQGLSRSSRFDAGTVAPDGRMFINHAGLTPLYVVDLTAPTLRAAKVPMRGSLGFVHDWAFNPRDGLLYGGDTAGELAVLDPATGLRRDTALPGLPAGIAFGGAWFDPDGNLVLYRNNGEIYLADVNALTVAGPVSDRGSGFNDATRCTGWVDPQ